MRGTAGCVAKATVRVGSERPEAPLTHPQEEEAIMDAIIQEGGLRQAMDVVGSIRRGVRMIEVGMMAARNGGAREWMCCSSCLRLTVHIVLRSAITPSHPQRGTD